MSAPQKSPEWFKEREGKLTASSFGAAAGLGPGSRQQAWRRHFGLEVFTGNEATQWGEDKEPVARTEYMLRVNPNVAEVGFVPHPSMEWLGASPDLLIDGDGLGEIKCPFMQKFYDEIPPYYMAQMQGQLQITDRQWCDFIIWTPDAMSVQRVYRSNEYWDWLHLRLADFWCWVQAGIEPPREKKPALPKIAIKTDEVKIFSLKP
jgi:putative phage-type endonuclease